MPPASTSAARAVRSTAPSVSRMAGALPQLARRSKRKPSMSRRPNREIRTGLPDPKFKGVVVTKFMNMVMERGKKSVAEKIVYGALDQIATKKKGEEPAVVLQTAFDN